MTHSFLRGFSLSLVLAALLGYIGCSAGTNTGNGIVAGTGGLPGSCPYLPCSYSANATGPDGTTYRGRISADISVASYSYAQSLPNPPVAELTFGGSEVDLSDAGCQVTEPQNPYQVQIFITTADSSIDASGALHVRGAPRDGYYASGPSLYANNSTAPGWAVDLAVTAGGQLMGTLSEVTSSSLDAGAATQELIISGPLGPSCVPGPDGKPVPASIPVSGGGTFSFPCWQPTGCSDYFG